MSRADVAGRAVQVRAGTPRLLVNRERVGEAGPWGGPGFDFESAGTADVLYQGDCDAGARELARLCGWGAELDALIARYCGEDAPTSPE